MSSPSAAGPVSRYNEDGTHPGLPAGFRFCPSAQVIVQQFLAKKVSGTEMPDSPIKELDLYRFDPEQLPITIADGRERWMYFFVFMSDENVDRSTPNGYWKVDEQDVRIKDELTKKVIGFKNSFVWYTNEIGPNRRYKTNWVMDEYRTKGIENHNDPQMKNWVLCKIGIPITQ